MIVTGIQLEAKYLYLQNKYLILSSPLFSTTKFRGRTSWINTRFHNRLFLYKVKMFTHKLRICIFSCCIFWSGLTQSPFGLCHLFHSANAKIHSHLRKKKKNWPPRFMIDLFQVVNIHFLRKRRLHYQVRLSSRSCLS